MRGDASRVAEHQGVLPSHEIDVLTTTAVDAVDLANAGQVVHGYNALCAGLERAREAHEAGESWGAELVTRWQLAINHYCAEYGVEL